MDRSRSPYRTAIINAGPALDNCKKRRADTHFTDAKPQATDYYMLFHAHRVCNRRPGCVGHRMRRSVGLQGRQEPG